MAQLVLKNILAGSGNVLAGGDNSGNVTKVTIGSNLTLTGGVLSATGGGSGSVSSVAMTVPTGLTVTGSPITSSGTLALTFTSGYSIPTTASQTNWDTAYTDRNKWDGGATGLTASTGRTSLGATTVGSNLFTLTNPSAITFLRVNADNSVSALNAATFRTAIGAGTVTSVAALTIGTTGTNISSTVATGTTTPVITLNIPTASATNRGALSSADWTTFNSKQASLGTGTTSQFLRGDLAWATPPTPALDDLTNVTITTPSNGQLLRYQTGTWINFTPTYVAAGFFSATDPLSYNSGTGVFSISQATTSTNGYLSSTDFNTFNGKQAQLNGTGFVKASGTTISYDNSTYLTTTSAASTYLPLTGGTLSGTLTATGFFESSDKRLKKQLEANYAPQNVSDIKAYKYIKNGKEEVGYYAQDISDIIPSAVTEGKDGFLTVAYNQVLVAKIQYLENKLKEIQDELGRISK